MTFLRIIALYAACISIVSCSGFTFVGLVSNPGGTTSITGTVLTVNGGFVSDPQRHNSGYLRCFRQFGNADHPDFLR